MKIAVSTEGRDIESSVDQRFGRAAGFLVYDTETSESVYVDNRQNLDSSQGAGIQSAKTVIDSGAEAVITGNVGPKAFAALDSAGVKIYLFNDGSVLDAINHLHRGELRLAVSANVDGHW